jgi:hypothetical protein
LTRRLDELVGLVQRGPIDPIALCDHVLAAMLPGADRFDDVAVVAASLSGKR